MPKYVVKHLHRKQYLTLDPRGKDYGWGLTPDPRKAQPFPTALAAHDDVHAHLPEYVHQYGVLPADD